MNVLGLALRSLRRRSLASGLTAVSVALGVGLLVAVTTVRRASQTALDGSARGCDLVVAGKGTTALSAVMNAIFYADQPIDTVPLAAWEAVAADRAVLRAVPFAVGDVFRGFRVVGTTSAFFDTVLDRDGRPLGRRVAPGGRVFPDGEAFEAVVGAYVAARTGLTLGAEFAPTHGLEEGGGAHEHAERWRVVGVLEATGTPSDRAIFIPLRSFFHVKGHAAAAPAATSPPAMGDAPPSPRDGTPPEPHPADGPQGAGDPHDHDHDHDHDHPSDAAGSGDHALGAEVSALSTILVRLRAPGAAAQVAADWNARLDARASMPGLQIRRLYETLRKDDAQLKTIAILVTLVSAISILAALLNAVAGRRREIALLRALGARRVHVFAVVVLEAVIVCVVGGLLGVAFGHALVAAAAPSLFEELGIRIGAGGLDPVLYLQVAAGLLGLGLVAGALPAWRAYRTPVAENLHPID